MIRRPSPKSIRGIALALWLASIALPALADSPAALAEPGDEKARQSFERFAEGWMEKVKGLEANNRRNPTVRSGDQMTYTGYGDDFTIELRPTGHAVAPYIGLLRYTELQYSCQQERCSVASQMGITEIFRFQNGRWIY